MANLLGDKNVGDIVQLKEKGIATNYIIVHKGKPSDIYDESCDGVWLLREKAHSTQGWNAIGENYDFDKCQIKVWLNETFYKTLNPNVRQYIKTVNIPYKSGTYDTPVDTQLSCKVFLLGAYEMGYSTHTNPYLPVDGSILSYFSTNTELSNRACVSDDDTPVNFWLRSIHNDRINHYAWSVDINGSLKNIISYREGIFARPAFILPNSFDLDSEDENSSPDINVASNNLGTLTDGLELTYSVDDYDEIDTLNVTECIDDTEIRKYTATRNQEENIIFQGNDWLKIKNGEHTIKIDCDDGFITSSQSIVFIRACDKTIFTQKNPIVSDSEISICSLKIKGLIATDTILTCEVTNNANDTTPVWENCTAKVKSEMVYVFKNKAAENGFAFNFRISAQRGASGVGGYITSIEGGFE